VSVDVKTVCHTLRVQADGLAKEARALAEACKVATRPAATATDPEPDRGEMIANAMLATRHLEDARMRLGKVIQAYDGGVSVYDK
jgi:hypothetical protein